MACIQRQTAASSHGGQGRHSEFVQLSNAEFRTIKAATPGAYTFILAATREVPKRLAHPRKRTVGVRIPKHPVVRALLRELGKPLVSSTFLLPGEDEPMRDGWTIKDRFDHEIDAVVDAGDCGIVPTTVVDFTQGYPEVVRVGAGDPAPFVGRADDTGSRGVMPS